MQHHTDLGELCTPCYSPQLLWEGRCSERQQARCFYPQLEPSATFRHGQPPSSKPCLSQIPNTRCDGCDVRHVTGDDFAYAGADSAAAARESVGICNSFDATMRTCGYSRRAFRTMEHSPRVHQEKVNDMLPRGAVSDACTFLVTDFSHRFSCLGWLPGPSEPHGALRASDVLEPVRAMQITARKHSVCYYNDGGHSGALPWHSSPSVAIPAPHSSRGDNGDVENYVGCQPDALHSGTVGCNIYITKKSAGIFCVAHANCAATWNGELFDLSHTSTTSFSSLGANLYTSYGRARGSDWRGSIHARTRTPTITATQDDCGARYPEVRSGHRQRRPKAECICDSDNSTYKAKEASTPTAVADLQITCSKTCT